MNGPSIRDDRIAFNDPNLLWADEGRRRVLRRYQDESENRQEPVHGNALRKTPFTVIIIDRCDKSQFPGDDFIEVWPRRQQLPRPARGERGRGSKHPNRNLFTAVLR
jgi:hypothetical protein